MAVAFDATSNLIVTSTTSLTVALTVASNACLVCFVALEGASGLSISAVFANGVQMTQLRRVENAAVGSSPISSNLYVLTAAPVGVVSISANIVGGVAQHMGLVACSYTGQRTAGNPFSAVAVATAGAQSSVHFTISHSSGDVVVLMGGCTNSLSSNCTLRAANGANFGFYMGDSNIAPNTATSDGFSFSTSMSFTTNFIHTYIGLNIAAVRATTTLRAFRRILMDVGA